MGISNFKKSGLPTLPGKVKPYVMAHRGNQVQCPENTLAAFKRAISDGADIIETDLHLTRDGAFVCIHDATLDRTTNGTGPVAEKNLHQIRQLSASNHFSRFLHERIPTLEETAAIIPPDVALALELKTDAFLDEAVCQKLVDILNKSGLTARTLVISFSLPRITAVKKVAPEIHTGWITLSRLIPAKGPEVLGPYWRLLLSNPFYVVIAHLRKQAVCPLDNRPDSRLWLYRLLGCDAVITDDPEKTIQKLGRR